jgi:hypothetical protein
MTTAEGGMIVLRDAKLAEALRLKKAFGVDRAHGERKVPGVYDVVELGFNYRMSEIHAAIGIEQLKKVPDFLHRRRANAEALADALAAIEGIRLLPSSTARLAGTGGPAAANCDGDVGARGRHQCLLSAARSANDLLCAKIRLEGRFVSQRRANSRPFARSSGGTAS